MEDIIKVGRTEASGQAYSNAKRQEERERRVDLAKEKQDIRARKKEREDELKGVKRKYLRKGKRFDKYETVSNKRVKSHLKKVVKQEQEAAESAARAEILLTEQEGFLEAEDEMEKTYKMTQKQLGEMVDMNSKAKMMDLKLQDHAPYRVAWTKNGRFLAIGGKRGHVSVLDALRLRPRSEIFLQETVRDLTFLHNDTLHAVAQKKHIYIYDSAGREVHRLRSHIQPERLEFLPYHFLLASVGRGGWLKYQDTSTGDLAAEHRTKLGPCNVMAQNPSNAIICLGHGSGNVTMWSPSVSKPLIKIFCHNAAIASICVSKSGNELCTAGRDGKVAIWDLRMYGKIHSYHTPRPAESMDISQTGLLALACGYQTLIWKDALRVKQQSPYLRHAIPGQEISHIKFRPYEDVLGMGTSAGVQSILVPGAGLANYDAFEANPFETGKQRRETEVHALLEKLHPDMITLDTTVIGKVNSTDQAVLAKEAEEKRKKNEMPKKERNKARGKGKIGNKIKNKHRNIITAEREALRHKLQQQAEREEQQVKELDTKEPKNALFQRFASSSR